MEFLDEIDQYGNIVGKKSKEELQKNVFSHKATLIVPRGQQETFILAMRSEKEPYPNTWVCGVGGTNKAGESFLETAHREAWEEIGYQGDFIPLNTFTFEKDNWHCIFRVYTTKNTVRLKELTPDPREIQYLKEFTKEELIDLIQNHEDDVAPTAVMAIKQCILGMLI